VAIAVLCLIASLILLAPAAVVVCAAALRLPFLLTLSSHHAAPFRSRRLRTCDTTAVRASARIERCGTLASVHRCALRAILAAAAGGWQGSSVTSLCAYASKRLRARLARLAGVCGWVGFR
jgi:hypothetical protein